MERTIAGRPCTLLLSGQPHVLFLWGCGAHGEQLEEVNELFNRLTEQGVTDFALLCYPVKEWFSDFAPWQGETGGRTFGGNGRATLRWLVDAAVPEMREALPPVVSFIPMGYSLSGLFALWAFAESRCFRGAVSCSGTMWFPGWMDYAAQAFSGCGERNTVYLSLGGKEERVKDPVMSQIGTQTRAMEKLLKNAGCRCTLEMNAGGHFADSTARLAKGVLWQLKQPEIHCTEQ